MRLHLSEKRNSETIYCMLQRALVPFQNPLWIYKRCNFVAQTSSWLTKRQKSSWTNLNCFNIRRSISPWKGVILGQFILRKKESDEICVGCNCKNRILLMSLRTRFSSWFFQVAKSSLTNFYCFQWVWVHAFISLRKEGISRKFLTRCKERE